MQLDRSLCEGCPFDGVYEPLESRGAEDARFIIVTDAPSQAAAKNDRLLTPKQMDLLGEKLTEAGFRREEFRFTPACHCPFDPDAHVSKEKRQALKACRQHFMREVEHYQPEAVIPLGATAASQSFGKSVKITKVRGLPHNIEDLNTISFPLMSPGLVLMYPQNEPIFNADIAALARSAEHSYDAAASSASRGTEYEIVTDLQFLIDMDPEVLSFDTENTGLRWYQTGTDVRNYKPSLHKGKSIFNPKFQILTMQFSVEPGKGYMLVWDHPENPVSEGDKPRLRNQLRKLLCKEDRIVVGQNPKYDCVAMWMREGIRFRIGGDTLMLATLLDENMTERNLDMLTKIHVPEMAGYADKFNATYNKSRMWEVPISELLSYGVGDTDSALRIYGILEEQVAQDDKLWSHYCRVTIPGLNAFAALEARGMYIDEGSAMADFKEMMLREVAREEAELLHAIPREVKRDVVAAYTVKNRGEGMAEKALSLTRPDFVKAVLFTHPKGFRLEPRVFTKTTAKLKDESLREPSISAKDHLPYFFDTCPFTFSLAEYQKDQHLLNTNVLRFEENYIRGGMVRPVYNLHKAVTGRTSSEDPNGQNYPKRGARAKVYRKMFVPPPGYYVIEVDLSQAELRIAACMANDPTMIAIYRSGGDIHKATALIVAGLSKDAFERLPKAEQKELRQKAKAVNFGFLYGMGWRKFIGYAKTQYNVVFTENEAKRIRTAFFVKYSALSGWHDRMRELARLHKQVRSLSGRIRHLPMIDSPEDYIQQEAGRQAINSPVQEFGSSLGVMALGMLNEEIDPEYLMPVGFIHDAVVAYVKKEYVDWGMRTLKRYQQSVPVKQWFGVKLQVPIVADVGFGETLGEIHECEGFILEKPYDYSSLKDKEGNLLIQIPKQKTPPNDGRISRSPYTTPEDLEDEYVRTVAHRTRMIRVSKNKDVEKRMDRSRRQMIINRRNQAVKKEVQVAMRAGAIRRTRSVV